MNTDLTDSDALKFAAKVLRELASECAECEGTGKLRGEHGFEETCPICEDIHQAIAVCERRTVSSSAQRFSTGD